MQPDSIPAARRLGWWPLWKGYLLLIVSLFMFVVTVGLIVFVSLLVWSYSVHLFFAIPLALAHCGTTRTLAGIIGAG